MIYDDQTVAKKIDDVPPFEGSFHQFDHQYFMCDYVKKCFNHV